MNPNRALVPQSGGRRKQRKMAEEEISFEEAAPFDADAGFFARLWGDPGASLRRLAEESGLDYLLRGMVVLALCGTLLLPAFVWYDGRRVQQTFAGVPAATKTSAAGPRPKRTTSRKALRVFAKRSYFQKPRPRAVVQKDVPVKTLPGLTDLYELQGILMGEQPQAIIADKTAGKTLFVQKGQRLGDFQVIEIQSDRIILQKEGERFELRI